MYVYLPYYYTKYHMEDKNKQDKISTFYLRLLKQLENNLKTTTGNNLKIT